MILLFVALLSGAQASTKEKPLHDADLKVRDRMVEISRQIGVTCTYCHDVKDFKKDDKPAYKVSLTHIEMVNGLNEKYSGKIGEKVDCFMCHRGQAKWDYKEKAALGH